MLNTLEMNADQCRALELLASLGPQGCTGATLIAHGCQVDVLAELVRDGFVTAYREPLKAGKRQIEVARIRITPAGRLALEG